MTTVGTMAPVVACMAPVQVVGAELNGAAV